jgi:hypothetical protein
MLYTNQEAKLFECFNTYYIGRWFYLKKIKPTIFFDSYIDFWVKDKQKAILIYKSVLFLSLLAIKPRFIYRSGTISFRNKFKPDTLKISNNFNLLLAARHFLYFGRVFRKADFVLTVNGCVFKDLADYIKSNIYDFYYFHVSLRVIFRQSVGGSVVKSLYRIS